MIYQKKALSLSDLHIKKICKLPKGQCFLFLFFILERSEKFEFKSNNIQ